MDDYGIAFIRKPKFDSYSFRYFLDVKQPTPTDYLSDYHNSDRPVLLTNKQRKFGKKKRKLQKKGRKTNR